MRTGITRADIDDLTCNGHNIHLLLMTDVFKDPQCITLKPVVTKVKKCYRCRRLKPEAAEILLGDGREDEDEDIDTIDVRANTADAP